MNTHTPKDTQNKRQKAPSFPLFYFFLCILLYLIALPFLLVSAFRAKHRDSIPARFSPLPKGLRFQPQIWFHACSFGEVKSLEPLLNALDSKPYTILITTITHTGFREAQRLCAKRQDSQIMVRYLPFEIFLPLWSRSLAHLQCLVVTEAEMWKMLFYLAKSHHARTMLINARISERSLKSYQYFAWFYQGIFSLIDEVLAQSHIDKERLENLGARHIEVFGNLKTLNSPTLTATHIKPPLPIFCAASTHKGEEKLILESFHSIYKDTPHAPLLLIAPRHPERFKEVYEMAKTYFDTALFSHSKLKGQARVIIIDTLGELNNLYAISDVVILGGSFVDHVGGHNPLEPAFFHTKLISGEHIFNQYALFEEVQNYVLIPPQSLQDTLLRWQELPQSAIKSDSSHKLALLLQKIEYAS